jgi:hypothetical protein
MKALFRLAMVGLLLVSALILAGVVARLTGAWPARAPTHARPHQGVP